MITKTRNKRTNIKRNVTEIAFIQYQLKKNGFSQQDIADDLKISKAAVSMAIRGKGKVTRVDEWLKDKLGLEVVNG